MPGIAITPRAGMELEYARCAGLDVHEDTVVACVRVAGGGISRETMTFGTMTRDLRALRAWLANEQVTHVAMEATGVYSLPVWRVLEGTLEHALFPAVRPVVCRWAASPRAGRTKTARRSPPTGRRTQGTGKTPAPRAAGEPDRVPTTPAPTAGSPRSRAPRASNMDARVLGVERQPQHWGLSGGAVSEA